MRYRISALLSEEAFSRIFPLIQAEAQRASFERDDEVPFHEQLLRAAGVVATGLSDCEATGNDEGIVAVAPGKIEETLPVKIIRHLRDLGSGENFKGSDIRDRFVAAGHPRKNVSAVLSRLTKKKAIRRRSLDSYEINRAINNKALLDEPKKATA